MSSATVRSGTVTETPRSPAPAYRLMDMLSTRHGVSL